MELSERDLQQVEEYIFARLPWVLKEDPAFVTLVEGIVAEAFPRRDEFARLLDEMTALRQEQRERLDQVDGQLEQVDGRLDQMDGRFDQVDQRFDQVDQRLDQMDERFQNLKDWVEMVVGRFQTRSGRKLEDVVAGALRLALKRPDIRPESIRLRQKIVDTEGRFFPRGREKEFDLLAEDSHYLVFEVKSAAEVEDVETFHDKVELVRALHPDKAVQGVLITLAPEEDVRQRCQQLDIGLVS